MASTPDAAASLLQTGAFMAGVLIVQAAAVRRLPLHDVPPVLRDRVVLSNRLRPWLLVTAIAMVAAGLFLAAG